MKRLKQLLQPNRVSSLLVNYTRDPIRCDAGEASVRCRRDLKETERERKTDLMIKSRAETDLEAVFKPPLLGSHTPRTTPQPKIQGGKLGHKNLSGSR